MGPGKIWHARVPNCTNGEIKVKLTVIPQSACIKSLTALHDQYFRKFLQLPFSVLSSCLFLLFLFHDTLTDLPIGRDHAGVDCGISTLQGLQNDLLQI